jgi:hypothetical protein
VSGFIDIDPSSLLQIERLIKKFGELPPRLMGVGTEAAAKYILMIFRKKIPPYRHVTRKAAYPPSGWQSDKQRKAVMAMIREGEIKIPYPRRSPAGGLAASWEMIGSGVNLILVNETPSAPFVYGEEQSHLINMVGWEKASTTLEEHERQATDAAARAIQKEIDKAVL